MGPTYTPDLARQLVALAATDGYGVVHATGVGEVSWHGFATETLRLAGLADVPVHEATVGHDGAQGEAPGLLDPRPRAPGSSWAS